MKALIILILSCIFLLQGCIGASRGVYYNTIVDCDIIVLDKRYIPGFTNPDKYQFKVKEEDEYYWVDTSAKLYALKHKNDTIHTTLIFQSH